MRSPILVTAFSVIVFLFSPAIVAACSCMSSGPPCQSYWNTPIVFSGRVFEITTPKIKETRSATFPEKTIRFAVNQAFRGISGTTAEVVTGMGGGDCGYDFELNENYLVYADNHQGKIYAGICSRTQLLSKAVEDIEYINNLSTTKAGATIYGAVHKYRQLKSDEEWQPNLPLLDIRLTLVGNDKTYEATTDIQGKFRVADLASGSYTLRLLTPKGFYPFETTQKIKVYDKGCAVADFTLAVNTSLSGRISDEKGAAAAKIKVNLIPVELINERHQKDTYSAWTEDDGRFTFRTVPSGKYHLGIRLDRIVEPKFAYPRTFYPGTQNLAEAATITVNEGNVFENHDFQLPPKLAERKIKGIVIYPDGKPAQNASISTEEVEYSEGSMGYGGDAKIETDGRFSLTRLNGLRYIIRAYVSTADGKQRHAEPIEIPADGNVANLKLVITEPNGNCDKCLRWTRKKN